MHAKTRLQKESNHFGKSLRHCRASLVPFPKGRREAAPSRDIGGCVPQWRIWRISSGATLTATPNVKVGSAGLRRRAAWRGFCGGSPKAERFRVCKRAGTARGRGRLLHSCPSAPYARAVPASPVEEHGRRVCAWTFLVSMEHAVPGSVWSKAGWGAGVEAQASLRSPGRNAGVLPCSVLRRPTHIKKCLSMNGDEMFRNTRTGRATVQRGLECRLE